MELLYKEDWYKVKERFKAFWNCEIYDRCCISVTAPRDGASNEEPPKRADIEEMWTDPEFFKEFNEYRMTHTFYGGEALPIWRPGRYPFTNSMAAMLGGRVELNENTAWVFPIFEAGELTDYDYRTLKFSDENYWYRHEENTHKMAASESRDKCLPGLYLCASSGDTLAALRGTEQLLIDLIECPDYVREFDNHLVKMSLRLFEKYYRIVKESSEGTVDWLSMWSPLRSNTLQNDFAYMISCEMFNHIFLETIKLQTEFFDYTLYHVDGIGNFKHVDSLCSLPCLNALQIYPGAGKESVLKHMPLLKKVQAAGKGLWLCLEPREIEAAMGELSSKGLFIWSRCESEKEARQLIENVSKWTHE